MAKRELREPKGELAKVLREVLKSRRVEKGHQAWLREAAKLSKAQAHALWWGGEQMGETVASKLWAAFPTFKDRLYDAWAADRAARQKSRVGQRANVVRIAATTGEVGEELVDALALLAAEGENGNAIANALTRMAQIGWHRVAPHLDDLLDDLEKLRARTSGHDRAQGDGTAK